MKTNSMMMVFQRFVASQFGGTVEARIFLTRGGSAPETDIIYACYSYCYLVVLLWPPLVLLVLLVQYY